MGRRRPLFDQELQIDRGRHAHAVDAHGKWTLAPARAGSTRRRSATSAQAEDLDQPRANFRLSQGYAAFTAGLRPTRWTRLHGEVAYEANQTDEGHGKHPSIETLYTP